MNWKDGLSWLSALKATRVERPAHERDHAEMGTAFGLEASMVGPPGDGSPPTWQPVPASAAAEAWERRVVRRSGL